MWTCPVCSLEFVNVNQAHSCVEKPLNDFLAGKSPHTIQLFDQLLTEFNRIGAVTVHPTKSMISFASKRRFAYVIQLGKNFMDIVFPFKEIYADNLCFNKIKQVPGSDDFNHHLRIYLKEDLNDEVRKYMEIAYRKSCQ